MQTAPDKEILRQQMEERIWRFLLSFREEHQLPPLWRRPLIGFADTDHPGFLRLRQAVLPDHALPQEILPDCRTAVVCFLPFSLEVIQSNREGRYASPLWVMAYQRSAQVLGSVGQLIQTIAEEEGFRAVIPTDTGYAAPGLYKSRWSHRHIAFLAGMGTFGKHNLLITSKGCCGYYTSLVTTLPLTGDPIPDKQACLFYQGKDCGLCIKQCVGGALTKEGFCREKCYAMCMENQPVQQKRGLDLPADACGKCAVCLPCSFASPYREE